VGDRFYVALACDDTLGVEETCGKLGIVAWGSHGYGNVFPCEADLEGFFDRHVILRPLMLVVSIT
jgi:hypothetical protein